ncbi:hypothetical protein AB0J83_25545 [Actinoplanes sp. NPDC049596]|uniref:hypothetical protein n=1 Tax=unclassified Actinoplanes TaxID=2626549 RepID=UPI0034380E84
MSGPATAAELAALIEFHGDALPADLLSFHRIVAEVRLPDIGPGYWIHRPPLPGEDQGHPRRLTDGRAIAVFGSDGSGALFALADGQGVPSASPERAALVGGEDAPSAGMGDGVPAGMGDGVPAGMGDGVPAGMGDGVPAGRGDAASSGRGGAVVLRLSGGAQLGDAYDVEGVTQVAGNLLEFLAFLRREVADGVG